MNIESALIIGWEVNVENLIKDGYKYTLGEVEVEAESEFDFVSQVAKDFGLHPTQTDTEGDYRLFLTLHEQDVLECTAETMYSYLEKHKDVEEKLVNAGLVNEGSFFIGSDLCVWSS